jgi:hypothetical protein
MPSIQILVNRNIDYLCQLQNAAPCRSSASWSRCVCISESRSAIVNKERTEIARSMGVETHEVVRGALQKEVRE